MENNGNINGALTAAHEQRVNKLFAAMMEVVGLECRLAADFMQHGRADCALMCMDSMQRVIQQAKRAQMATCHDSL